MTFFPLPQAVSAKDIVQGYKDPYRGRSGIGGGGGRDGVAPPDGKKKDTHLVVSRMKGVDSKLAQTILDELVEQ